MIELIECISIIIASFTAIYGIGAWRREMRGRNEYNLVEEVLVLFYEARDRIRAIRAPFVPVFEEIKRETDTRETKEKKFALDRAYIVMERYQKYQEVFNKLHTLRYRFMALFGEDKVKPFDDLWSVINNIFIAVSQLPFNECKTAEEVQEYLEIKQECEKYFSSTFIDKDPIEIRVNEIIANIDKICGKILQRKNSVNIGIILTNTFTYIKNYLLKNSS